MPSVGFEGAFGQQAMAEQIRQRMIDELNKTVATHAMSVDDQKLALEKQRYDQEAQDRALLRAQQGQTFNEKIAEGIGTNLGPGRSVISPELAHRFVGTTLEPLVSASATLPSTQFAAGGAAPSSASSMTASAAPPEPQPSSTAPMIRGQLAQPTGTFDFSGMPAANEKQRVLMLRGQLLSDPSLTPQQRIEMQAESAGLKAPTREQKPAVIGDANYMLNGKPIVGLKNNQGRIQYQGKDVTDFVQPYVAPKQTDTVDQGKLEQQYRTVLARGLSSRSGGLGLEDSKVQQANHLIALMDQNYDTRTGEYHIPAVMQAELALGLARLTSPGGQVGEGMMHEMNQRTAKGDLAGVLTYLTGTPMTGSTQDVFKMFKDSIERQGQIAEQNREGEMRYLRGLAPTDLDESRRQSLESNSLNPLRRSRVIQNQQTGERKIQASIDGGKTWQ